MGKKKKEDSFESQMEELMPTPEEEVPEEEVPEEEAPEVGSKEAPTAPERGLDHQYVGKGPVISKKKKEALRENWNAANRTHTLDDGRDDGNRQEQIQR